MLNYCRFCAEPLGLLDWSQRLKVSEQYLKMFDSLPDYIDINDTILPKAACTVCFNTFNVARSFCNQVKQSQIVLKELSNNMEFRDISPTCTMTTNSYVIKIKTECESDTLTDNNIGASIVQPETSTVVIDSLPHRQNPSSIVLKTIEATNHGNNKKMKRKSTSSPPVHSQFDINKRKSQNKKGNPLNDESQNSMKSKSIFNGVTNLRNPVVSMSGYMLRNKKIGVVSTPEQDINKSNTKYTELQTFNSINTLRYTDIHTLKASTKRNNREESITKYKGNIIECFVLLDKLELNAKSFDSAKRNEKEVNVKHEPEENIISNINNTNKEHQSTENYFIDTVVVKESIDSDTELATPRPNEVVADDYIDNEGKSWTGYKWVCCHCETEFQDMTELRAHSKVTHKICYAFKCMDCDKKYNQFNPFIEHVRLHREVLRNYCQYCNVKFKGRTKCEEHALKHWVRTERICLKCGEILPNAASLNQHDKEYEFFNVPRVTVHKLIVPDSEYNGISSWEDYQWDCQDCCVRMPNKEALRTHAQVFHDKCFVMKCMDCLEVETHYTTFVEHVRKHRPYLKKYCQFCNQYFENSKDLYKHEAKHITGQSKPCEICGQMFKNKVLLLQHTTKYQSANIHKKENELFCDYCNESFWEKGLLVKHIEKHIEYRCDVCGVIFKNKINLKYHVDSHYLWFLCKVCDEPYSNIHQCVKHTTQQHGVSMAKHEVRTRCKFDIKTGKPIDNSRVPVVGTFFVCDSCGAPFTNKLDLVTHISSHNKYYRCDLCSKDFKFKKSLGHHIQIHLKKDASLENRALTTRKSRVQKKLTRTVAGFPCNVCDMCFESLKLLKAHEKCHEVNIPQKFTCQTCGRSFLYKHHLNYHAKTHNVKTEVCPVCKKSFHFKYELKSHLNSHSNFRPFVCNKCGHSQKTRRTLKRHFARVHPSVKFVDNWSVLGVGSEQSYNCEVCNKHYEKKDDWIFHTKSHYWWFLCNICDEPYNTIYKCASHATEQHGVTVAKHEVRTMRKIDTTTGKPVDNLNPPAIGTIFVCNDCGAPFSTKQGLETHILSSNKNNFVTKQRNKKKNTSTYECKVCGKHNQSKAHIESHLNMKNYACDICVKTFNTPALRYKHMIYKHRLKRVHGELIPCTNYIKNRIPRAICKVCGKSVYSIWTLKLHMKTHEGNRSKNFVCQFCGKTFLYKCSIERHMLTHGAKTQECQVCKMRFHDKDMLRGHFLRVHSSPKLVYKCEVCNKSYTKKCSLRNHTESHYMWFLCNICDKPCNTAASCKRHTAKQHGVAVSKRTLRTVCKIDTKTGNPIDCSRAPLAENIFVCDDCGAPFTTKQGLETHILSCNKESVVTYECDICGVHLITKKDLKHHIMKKHLKL